MLLERHEGWTHSVEQEFNAFKLIRHDSPMKWRVVLLVEGVDVGLFRNQIPKHARLSKVGGPVQ